jgi:hypothetical protein
MREITVRPALSLLPIAGKQETTTTSNRGARVAPWFVVNARPYRTQQIIARSAGVPCIAGLAAALFGFTSFGTIVAHADVCPYAKEHDAVMAQVRKYTRECSVTKALESYRRVDRIVHQGSANCRFPSNPTVAEFERKLRAACEPNQAADKAIQAVEKTMRQIDELKARIEKENARLKKAQEEAMREQTPPPGGSPGSAPATSAPPASSSLPNPGSTPASSSPSHPKDPSNPQAAPNKTIGGAPARAASASPSHDSEPLRPHDGKPQPHIASSTNMSSLRASQGTCSDITGLGGASPGPSNCNPSNGTNAQSQIKQTQSQNPQTGTSGNAGDAARQAAIQRLREAEATLRAAGDLVAAASAAAEAQALENAAQKQPAACPPAAPSSSWKGTIYEGYCANANCVERGSAYYGEVCFLEAAPDGYARFPSLSERAKMCADTLKQLEPHAPNKEWLITEMARGDVPCHPDGTPWSLREILQRKLGANAN